MNWCSILLFFLILSFYTIYLILWKFYTICLEHIHPLHHPTPLSFPAFQQWAIAFLLLSPVCVAKLVLRVAPDLVCDWPTRGHIIKVKSLFLSQELSIVHSSSASGGISNSPSSPSAGHFVWLELTQVWTRCHNCCGFLCAAVLCIWKTRVFDVIHCLWLLESLSHISMNIPEPLGEVHDMHVSFKAEHLQSVMLCLLTSWESLC